MDTRFFRPLGALSIFASVPILGAGLEAARGFAQKVAFVFCRVGL
jgi:hypothetical protein